jgi:broad specificity phosphatase PhoE
MKNNSSNNTPRENNEISKVEINNNSCQIYRFSCYESLNKIDILKQQINTPKVKHFYFLRHGSTDWNMEMLILGPQDLSLNETGKQQVKYSASLIKNKAISYIITSSLKRCVESKEIVTNIAFNENPPLEIDTNLQERNFGDWSLYQQPIKTILDTQPDKTKIKYNEVQKTIESLLPAEAETKAQFIIRVAKSFAKHLNNNTIQDAFLFISHGCIKSELLNLMNLQDIDLNYGSILSFDYITDKWQVNKLIGEIINAS